MVDILISLTYIRIHSLVLSGDCLLFCCNSLESLTYMTEHTVENMKQELVDNNMDVCLQLTSHTAYNEYNWCLFAAIVA